MSKIKSILRQSTRKEGERINILCAPTHERYENLLAQTNCEFYAYQAGNIKKWNTSFGPLPDNYHILRPLNDGEDILGPVPTYIDWDAILTQSKGSQYQVHFQLAKKMGLPLISLEHTLPTEAWEKSPIMMQQLKTMRGDLNIFISEYSMGKWLWSTDEGAEVIYHGVDTDIFIAKEVERKPHILSVVNDWVNRDWCCGFNLWRESVQNLPVRPVGATPGLSEAAKSIDDLVNEYSSAQVFINTSLISPIPTALLEAAACGCAIVSTNNCAIPELITHGYNGFLANKPHDIHNYCKQLLADKELRQKFGENARKTVLEKFGKEVFISKWNSVFQRASNIIIRG